MGHAYDNWLAGDGGIDQAEQDREERIDEIVEDYRNDIGAMKRAADWTDGSFTEEQCTDLSLALYDLIRSGAVAQLYRIAAVRAAQIDAFLRQQAEAQADEEAEEPVA